MSNESGNYKKQLQDTLFAHFSRFFICPRGQSNTESVFAIKMRFDLAYAYKLAIEK